MGDMAALTRPMIALVGARNASSLGLRMARSLAAELAEQGFVVVSGLARGIDTAAHLASLEAGTLAVMAGGVDVIYPAENTRLSQDILRTGLRLSEQPVGLVPQARHFPTRNRLISGLARAVIVVEAAARSGSLITARTALDQGREVFAVPGSPLDPRCQGANRLIRDGATLVENAQDIIDALAAQNRGAAEGKRDLFDRFDGMGEPEPEPAAMLSLRRQIKELLSFTPLHRDEILREADAPPGLVADALLDLVLAGEAVEHEGGRFSLRAD